MRVLLVTSDAAWQERSASIAAQAGWSCVVDAATDEDAAARSALVRAARDVDAVLVHVDVAESDPMPALAPLWRAYPSLPVLLFGDAISSGVRDAALIAGVAHVGRAMPTPEELVAATTLACDDARVGSPELVRAMCRAMCSLSTTAATASDETAFLAAAVQETSALFAAPIVSIMMIIDDEESAADHRMSVSMHVNANVNANPNANVNSNANADVNANGSANAPSPELVVVAATRPFIGRRARPHGVAARVVAANVARIVLREADRDDELALASPRSDVTASMCVPIPGAAGRGVRGVINVARTTPHAVFVPRDLDICLSVARLIAEALDAIAARRTSSELRERIAAVERLSTVGEMAAGIAHEVANPIASVCANVHHIIETMGVLSPILKSIEGDADIEERLDDLPALLAETWEGLQRATDVIKQMKALVRMNEDASTRDDIVELGAIAENTVRLLRTRLGGAVRVEVNGAPVVRGSPVELSQALVNLAVNAADACEERRAREPGHEPAIVIRAGDDGDHAVIEVSDNGAGIPQPLLRRIFAPLFTTKTADRGTGLGLAIVRRVVESHGGKISVASVVGEGTTFRVQVPRAFASAGAAAQLRAS